MRRLHPAPAAVLAISASLALSAGPAPVAAQEDSAPGLASALGRVPDTLAHREELVSWVDFRAVESARPGALQPASLAELMAALDADDPAAERWMAAFQGVRSGPGDLLRSLFATGTEWPRVVGFDFLDVDRALQFGAPPADGMVLEGAFDMAAIAAAFSARDYTSTEAAAGFARWCPPRGCETGMEFDLADRDTANPFGGELGRSEPLGASDTALASSADIAVVDGIIDASADALDALGDDPAYSAVVAAMGDEGTLIQATLVPGSMLAFDPLMLGGPDLDPEQREAILAELMVGFEPMPQPVLVGIADGATDTEQVVRVVLAFPSPADAQAAAAVLPDRIESVDSLVTGQPVRELLDERGVTATRVSAAAAQDGLGVVIVELRAPLAGDEPDDAGRLVTSSRVHALLIDMVLRLDLVWLLPVLPAAG